MLLTAIPPRKTLNKAYARQAVDRAALDLFIENLKILLDRLQTGESEEHQKNLVRDFLKDSWYAPDYLVNTSERIDLAIYDGNTVTSPVAVIIEAKSLVSPEMMSLKKPNTKAFRELMLYYLRQVIDEENHSVKYLIVTNGLEWFIFDGLWFEKHVRRDAKLVKAYREQATSGHDTRHFYGDIAKPWLDKRTEPIPCVHIDLNDYRTLITKDDPAALRKLTALYKLLSPQHLLKKPFANDSNSLNRAFYAELLHILGLEEVKEQGKKLIERMASERRLEGSLLENCINVLRVQRTLEHLEDPEKYGESEEEQLFSIALELCITWLNRILFMKLLEGELTTWNRDGSFPPFLNAERITDFDDMQELFFEVLARKSTERTGSVIERFGSIPYLNSSLFEVSELERRTIQISSLKDRLSLPLHGRTVLKDEVGKRKKGELKTLRYLFDFLDAYDFGSEGDEEVKEAGKSIINAAVLGLIFEKINGYKDGSFFTPGFITMYICRQTIRREVVRKFNDAYGWQCSDIDDLYNRIDPGRLKEANQLVNSLKLCDPAVGSGHFLVSALNEIIAVKSDLGILVDAEGKRLRDYRVTVENDELMITCDDEFFSYNPKNPESRRVQETLFQEKATIIENCLFGVDINPKSVAICRLRLWVELLKNAYYTKESGYTELETLPNIDINIKTGNSLVSRYSLSGQQNIAPAQRKKLRELAAQYRERVFEYKLSPSNKAQLRKVIESLKADLAKFGVHTLRELAELEGKRQQLSQQSIFELDQHDMAKHQKLLKEIEQLEMRLRDKEEIIFPDAFEWRFEFPEVLDENGEFAGFDLVIGNPPYIRQEAIKDQKPVFKEMFGDFFAGTADIYTYFYKVGLDLLKPGGTLCYIAPNKFMRAGYGKNTRKLLTCEAKPITLIDFGDLPVFEEATTYPSIVMVERRQPQKSKKIDKTGEFFAATLTEHEQMLRFVELLPDIGFPMEIDSLKDEGWTLERPAVHQLMEKLRKKGKPLGEYVDGRLYRGVLTGLNDAFVIDAATRQALIDEDPKSAELIKPWLRGRDVKKWCAEWAGLFLIAIASSANAEWPWSKSESEDAARAIFAETYPAVHRHVSQWDDRLPKRDDKGKFWWELRSCAYYGEFEKTKIVYQEIATYQSFGYSESGTLCNNKCFVIPEKDDYLLSLLNSKLLWWMICNLTSGLQGGARAMQVPYIEQLPIPKAKKGEQEAITALVEQILATKREDTGADVSALEQQIDQLVYQLYGLSEEEIALVEG